MNDASVQPQIERRGRLDRLVRPLVVGWALAGGFVLCAVVLVNVISVVGAAVWKPFPGDFELTEMGVAVAAFAFLPLCQMTDANVTADIFSSRASPRTLAWFSLAASIVALGFSLLLAWRMTFGLLDQMAYNYTTAILQVPLWMAYVPVLISLLLLALASLSTLVDHKRTHEGAAA